MKLFCSLHQNTRKCTRSKNAVMYTRLLLHHDSSSCSMRSNIPFKASEKYSSSTLHFTFAFLLWRFHNRLIRNSLIVFQTARFGCLPVSSQLGCDQITYFNPWIKTKLHAQYDRRLAGFPQCAAVGSATVYYLAVKPKNSKLQSLRFPFC